jgi:hypothetical protein
VTRYALAALLLLAGHEEPPAASPESPSPERRVDLRFAGFRIMADRMQGRIDEDGGYRIALAGPDRPVELQGPAEGILIQAREASLREDRFGERGRPDTGAASGTKGEASEVLSLTHVEARWAPARPLPGKAGRYLGDEVRLTADALEIRRRASPRSDEGSPDRELLEAKGRIRISGKAFSLSCEEVRFFPESRRIEFDRVRDVKLSLEDERRIPTLSFSTDTLDLGIDLDLREPFEGILVLSNPEGFDAKIDDARLRLRTLNLRLKK